MQLIQRSNETAKVFAKRQCCSYKCTHLHNRRPILVELTCQYCGAKLVRGQREERSDFLNRKYCNRFCFSRKLADEKRNPQIRGVYEIRNGLNGKIYIGASNNIHPRWSKHRKLLRRGKHNSVLLQSDWDEHGQEAFTFSVLETVAPTDNLTTREQAWYDKTQCTDKQFGYNTDPYAGTRLGATATAETRRRISAVTKGRNLGSKHHNARLTEADVLEIKHRLQDGETCATLGSAYNVSDGTIFSIRSNRTWLHVSWPDS